MHPIFFVSFLHYLRLCLFDCNENAERPEKPIIVHVYLDVLMVRKMYLCLFF
jgi:hypothetical protein